LARVTILTEGGRDIGLGHVTRCLSIAQAFSQKGVTPEFIVNLDGIGATEELANATRVRPVNWLRDQDHLRGILGETDVLIVDSYLAGASLYNRMADMVGLCVYLDDTNRLDYPPGVIINGAVDTEDVGYNLNKEATTYLLGPRYTPLRAAFWDVRVKEAREEIDTIMVLLGGTDMTGTMPTILNALFEGFPRCRKRFLVGEGSSGHVMIGSARDGNAEFLPHLSAEELKRTMLWADVAVSAGGQTLYELARVGVPTVAVSVADNQSNNIKGWERRGFIENAGWWQDKDLPARIVTSLLSLAGKDRRARMSSAGKAVMDGHGSMRIAEYLLDRIN
jgi:UDP-2,4-diacetamido-2,4,6-trideoxy-beta-L-altropyranose hydrolase